ncbi:methyltransferase domain-containing protein [Kineococcus sp. NBC_00420]|uniref:class I SAM-dependent methyltransferase n=1 Tax=Kineococcus sp. NBC_00420 TaxID=2903564 RepID=UPI002E1C3DFB
MPAPRPRHFDAHADVYDRGRPPYPDVVWARLRELEVLVPGARVLELGAGTGQATRSLTAAGTSVTAVEPGPHLARSLRRNLPDVEVRVGTAETAWFPTASFDVAVAATSVHWFDLDVVLPALHRWLVPNGSFVVVRNAFGDPTAALTPFRARIAEVTSRRSTPTPSGPGELDTADWVTRLTSGGLFAPRHVEEFRWSIDLTTTQVHDLFSTFSNWNEAEVDEAAGAVEELGGSVLEDYVTPLIVLRRR